LALALVVFIKFFLPGPISGDVKEAQSRAPGLRILFVGNSLTYENSLPVIVKKLAAGDAGAPRIFAVQFTPGGAQLSQDAHDSRLTKLIASVHWNEVVLQEQSFVPGRDDVRATHMIPAVTALDRRARAAGGQTVLFMTWGYEHGDPSWQADSFMSMQQRLAKGYYDVAARIGAPVAPVGYAWAEAHRVAPGLSLWADDGVHPSRVGSYLGASVLYALLTRRDPRGSKFTDGLDPESAQWLRRVALWSVESERIAGSWDSPHSANQSAAQARYRI
jgi:hypothetical protein